MIASRHAATLMQRRVFHRLWRGPPVRGYKWSLAFVKLFSHSMLEAAERTEENEPHNEFRPVERDGFVCHRAVRALRLVFQAHPMRVNHKEKEQSIP